MIRVENLTKTFRAPGGTELAALRDVTLQVGEGEFVAVVGPSGSGKSTLLFAMGGLASPTGGEVYLGKRKVYDLDPGARAALRRTEIGFVFQTFNLIPYLTCEQNVMLPALLAGRAAHQASAAAVAVLERLGLSTRRLHAPSQLSVGERQRVAMGRALVNAPRVLLADEPTGNLDPSTADGVMDLLHELNDEGQTIVMVTHDPRLSGQAARIVRLDSGEIAADRSARAEALAS
jgi:putative ABC transport system ATP-binding protein